MWRLLATVALFTFAWFTAPIAPSVPSVPSSPSAPSAQPTATLVPCYAEFSALSDNEMDTLTLVVDDFTFDTSYSGTMLITFPSWWLRSASLTERQRFMDAVVCSFREAPQVKRLGLTVEMAGP